ncbi:hypothetical protein ABN763_08695 [Spongiivirga sp. MCCC 1A20706]|uniref:hypothetical protein n=1 Tax=Spongiivirga sp. MCCC 1A20706 TaxID=3160963 RepID=UPI003977B3AC
MNNSLIKQFSAGIAFLLLSCTSLAQETKTYKEGFDVSKDVTLNVNTTHTDVQFETWDKDRVEIVATITVEDMDKEEAERYIKNWNFDAKGNSREIDISSGRGSGRSSFPLAVSTTGYNGNDFSFRVSPDFPGHFDVEPLLGIIDEMPPMPFVYSGKNKFSFDYEAYKKDGDKYVEKWKKEYKDKYDEEWEEKMEKWAKRLAERKERLEKKKSEYAERRKKLKERREKSEKERVIAIEKLRSSTTLPRGSVIWSDGGQNSFFRIYGGKDDENNAKVKKTIIIKMPKGTKLNMNVRHGEVKMANVLRNIKANLSHSSLLAEVIDGDKTEIKCSYAPVIVDNWNGGQLNVNYIKDVQLKTVKELKLLAKSSDVLINEVLTDAFLSARGGTLNIDKVDPKFESLLVGLENTDAVIVLPKTSYGFKYQGERSRVDYPESMKLDEKQSWNTIYLLNQNSNSSQNKIVDVNAKYSKVVLKNQ